MVLMSTEESLEELLQVGTGDCTVYFPILHEGTLHSNKLVLISKTELHPHLKSGSANTILASFYHTSQLQV